jgi:hypothetical protein
LQAKIIPPIIWLLAGPAAVVAVAQTAEAAEAPADYYPE